MGDIAMAHYMETENTNLHYLSWSLPLVIIFSVGAIVALIIWKNRKNPRPLKISEFSEMFHKLMANNCFYMREDFQGESSGEFIVCQPPSTNTNYEFWQMLWEQSVHTIIVIGLPQDRKKSPSSYWPSDLDKVEAYQDISVSLTELKKLKPYITWRRLLISREDFIFIYKCVLAAIEVNAYETTIEDDSYPYSTAIYHSI
ncbi:Tyrosine-protein phosphatase non-receptor type ptp-2 [Holothuria leucospilota]|uniref:Tyrosine-protein phosphatase non-receptor type ptp-2 n=1 Tax=Holothuria leucospilota TaxID=206669 RepID=A0A9Q1BRU6_HOLLE|nr:Tyrosine-protein phosphatase non-receptor type ptp-2 [Holothuria leucospilota]